MLDEMYSELPDLKSSEEDECKAGRTPTNILPEIDIESHKRSQYGYLDELVGDERECRHKSFPQDIDWDNYEKTGEIITTVELKFKNESENKNAKQDEIPTNILPEFDIESYNCWVKRSQYGYQRGSHGGSSHGRSSAGKSGIIPDTFINLNQDTLKSDDAATTPLPCKATVRSGII